MKLTLVYAPFTCSLVPYILLTEAGAEFDVRPVNLQRGDHLTPEFLQLNPKHRVPILLQDGIVHAMQAESTCVVTRMAFRK